MRFPKSYLVLLLIILLAFALRVYRLDFFSLRGDESFTVLFVQKPFAQMWHETLTVEPNPPLMYLMLRGWIAVAGASEFPTRFFSLFFGVLCASLIYRLAREIFSWRAVALVAAFLMALNPYQIWHSQDVRNYTLWPALSLLALIFFWKWYAAGAKHFAGRTFEASPNWAQNTLPLLWFVLAELAALYAHYYEAFILLALNLFAFATLWRDLKKLAQWIGAQIVLAVLYLPYPLILSNRVSAYGEGSGRQGVALWDVARETFSAFVLSDTLDENMRAWLWIPFALVALASLIYLLTRDWKRGLFFLLYAGVPTLAVFALNTIRPLYLERYLNSIAPAYYLLLAFGIVALARGLQTRFGSDNFRRAAIALAAILCAFAAFFALANYWMNPAYAKAPDWRGLAQIINTNAQRGDLIIQNFPETSLVYYDQSKLPLVVYPETFLPDTKTTQQLNATNANYQRVWFIPAAPEVWDPDQFVEAWLDRRFDLLNEWRVDNFRLRLYGTPSQFLNSMQRVNFDFENQMTLLGYRTERVNDALRIVLYWRARETLSRAYEIRITRLDENGKPLGEEKSVPARGAYPTTEWRKNQIIVDQHEIPNAANVKAFQVSVCEADTCLGTTSPLQP